MSIFREFNINMIPGKPPLIIHVSQYESDFVYTFHLVSGKSVLAIPDTAIAIIRGTKRDGNGYSKEASLDTENNKVVVIGEVQMTACAGKNVFELAIINDEKVICTANFFLDVERAPLDSDTIRSETVLHDLQAIINSAATATQAAEEASASATQAAESARTLTIDPTLTQSGRAADAKVVGNEIGDINDAIGTTGIMMQGGFIATNGQTVNPSSIVSSVIFKHAIVPCVAGDVFTVSGHGGSSPRLWCFTDSNYTVISVAGNGLTLDSKLLTAPSGASWLFINDDSNKTSYIGVRQVEVNTVTKNTIGALFGGELITPTLYNTYIATNTNVDVSAQVRSYGTHCYILDCAENDVFIITGTGQTTPRLWCFINVNGEIVSNSVVNAVAKSKTLITPKYAEKLIINVKESEPYLVYKGENIRDISSDMLYGNAIDLMHVFPVRQKTETSNGVTFTWYSTGNLRAAGTASSTATNNLYYNPSGLPNGITAGAVLHGTWNTNDNGIQIQYVFYTQRGQIFKEFNSNHVVIVPTDCTGMMIRARVGTGVTVNGIVDKIHIYNNATNNELYHAIRPKNLPLYISFIDDDTLNDTFVERYYLACKHNNINGAFAVETDRLDEEVTSADRLLQYEDEGFGMLTHCTNQETYFNKNGSDYSVYNSRRNITRAVRKMREYGFITYNHWVIPYGTKDEELRKIAKYLDMGSAISTSDNIHNSPFDNDKYYIKRVGMIAAATGSNSLEDIKSRIDTMVAEGQGWIIITTHFCDSWSESGKRWTDYTWDETLDERGYPVGYTLFNQMVDYAKSVGCTPVPYTVGLSLFVKGGRG